jgi:hypothetical protein
MLPPDDDYSEEGSGPNSTSDETKLTAAIAAVPNDLYEQFAPLLQLCAVANFLLLGRPADPVPQAIFQLTGFNLASARQVSRLRNSGELGQLLLRQPDQLFDFILLGQLTFNSPLFTAVCQLLPAPATDEDSVADSLRDFVVASSEAIIHNLTEYLTLDTSTLTQDWHLRCLQFQSIFARLEDTLIPTQLPPTIELPANAAATTAVVPPQLQLQFSVAQFQVLRVALALPEQLLREADQPFAQAVNALPSLSLTEVRALQQRLQLLNPVAAISFTLPEVGVLYQVAQMRALTLVSGAFDTIQMPAADGLGPARTPQEDCAELERFVQLVQASFPNEPMLAAARRDIEALAELL